MKDFEKIADTYAKLSELHINSYPNMREGQYLLNLLGWIKYYKGDPFFMESNKLIKYAEEYSSTTHLLHHSPL